LLKAKNLQTILDSLIDKGKLVQSYQSELEMKVTDFSYLEAKNDYFFKIVELWSVFYDWSTSNQIWIDSIVPEVNSSEISQKIQFTRKKMTKLQEVFEHKPELNKLCMTCLNMVNIFDSTYFEIISIVRHESFKDRHWRTLLQEMFLGGNIPRLDKLTFRALLDKGLRNHRSLINIISEKAMSEFIIDNRIDDIEKSISNIYIQIKGFDNSRNVVILNDQFIKVTLMEHKDRCLDMLRLSEHLETFFEQISSLLVKIETVENAINELMNNHESYFLLNTVGFFKDFLANLGKKDSQRLEKCLEVYSALIDSLRSQGVSYLIRNINKEAIRTSEDIGDSVTMISSNPASSVVDRVRMNQDFVASVAQKFKEYVIEKYSSTPRLLGVSVDKLIELVHLSSIHRICRQLELFFPEIVSFVFDKNSNSIITGFTLSNPNQRYIFDNPVNIAVLVMDDVLQNYTTCINEIETELESTLRNMIASGLNFFHNHAYNFEKFVVWSLENALGMQAVDLVIRAVFSNDVMLLLSNPMNPLSGDVVRTRLNYYKDNILDRVSAKIYQMTIKEFNQTQDGPKYFHYQNMLQILLSYDDLIRTAVEQQMFDSTSFFWQSFIKTSVCSTRESKDDLSKLPVYEIFNRTINHGLRDVDMFPNLFRMSNPTDQYHGKDLQISLHFFDRFKDYGYQLTQENQNVFYYPRQEKTLLSILLACSSRATLAIRGQEESGKMTSTRLAAHLCGRQLFEISGTAVQHGEIFRRLVMRGVGCGNWTYLSNIELHSEENLMALASVIQVLKREIEIRSTRNIYVEGIRFRLSGESHLLMSQSPKALSPAFQTKIPLPLLDEFRSITLVTVDLQSYIEGLLAELVAKEKFTAKIVKEWAAKLVLFFQLIESGLNGTGFFSSFTPNHGRNPEEFFQDGNYMKFGLARVKGIVVLIKQMVMKEQEKSDMNQIIFKAVYSHLKYQLSPEQTESLTMMFVSIFDPSSNFFQIQDNGLELGDFSLESFYLSNKLSPLSASKAISTAQVIAQTRKDSAPLTYLNYGRSLEQYGETFNKLLTFITDRIQDSPQGTNGITLLTASLQREPGLHVPRGPLGIPCEPLPRRAPLYPVLPPRPIHPARRRQGQEAKVAVL
jgi:hypothetical protein